MPFVQDPEGFLRDVRHTLLWDEQGGRYAAVIKHREKTEEKNFVWLRLDPDGCVFVSLLSLAETEAESTKWQILSRPPDVAAFMSAVGMSFQQDLNFSHAFVAFPSFLAKNKSVYDFLYTNALGIYQEIVVSPEQRRAQEAARKAGEEVPGTAPREVAMGFLYDNDNHALILVKEATGNGWVNVSFISKTAAAKFRAKLSAAKENLWGIRWKQIDVPYGMGIYVDKGIVFYKVVKVSAGKTEGVKTAGYMLEFRTNGGSGYIRFPHIFNSTEKLLNFIEKANGYRLKMWVREK
jgi:hypothetical protein